MASITLEFALNSVVLAKNSVTGGSSVGGRNVCFIPGAQGVIFGGVGKDGCNGRMRLVCAASTDPSGNASQRPKLPRKSRRKAEGPSKSDLKLVEDLREFISAYDLPPTDVPTTKELIRSGRQDLANSVRRRGYKTVAYLLGFAPRTEAAEKDSANEAEDAAADSRARDESENGAAGNSSTESQQMYNTVEEETEVLTVSADEYESRSCSPGGNISMEENAVINGFVAYTENALTEREKSANTPALVRDGQNVHSQRKESLRRTSFSERGDDIEQRQLDILKGRESGVDSSVEDGEESGNDYTDDEYDSDAEVDEEGESSMQILEAETDSSCDSPEEVAAKKAALLRSRILQYFDSRKGDHMKPETSHDDRVPKQVALEEENSATEKDKELENSQRLEAEKEIGRIKKLLVERELILVEVTKELEEAKAQFSLARAKATAELVHATQLAAEREAKLQAAEQALSSLRQVHLEWWGEAKHVEIAGTFNGWQHRILMEPDPSSEIPKPDGSRGSMMWGTHLCLYPGTYEIKFIVDGSWQLDHRREVVMRHGNQNNVLRVE